MAEDRRMDTAEARQKCQPYRPGRRHILCDLRPVPALHTRCRIHLQYCVLLKRLCCLRDKPGIIRIHVTSEDIHANLISHGTDYRCQQNPGEQCHTPCMPAKKRTHIRRSQRHISAQGQPSCRETVNDQDRRQRRQPQTDSC